MNAVLDPVRRPTRRTALVLVTVFTVVALSATTALVVLLVTATGPLVPSNPRVTYGVDGPPVAVGRGATDVEAGGGFLWVSNAEDATLTRIDPVTRTTRTIAIGGQPGQIAVGEGAVWVRNLGDRITRVDIATGAVSQPIVGGAGPITGMAVGGGHVWLSHREEDLVTRVDARTLAVVGPPIRVDRRPGVVEYDDGAVFVVGADGALSRLDAASATRVGTATVGESPGGVEVDRGTVYVAANGGVVPADGTTLAPGLTYTFDGWAYFEVNDGTMWVVYDQDPRIQRVDTVTRAAVGDPVPGLGADVGRARFAFDRLWLILPDSNQLIALGPS
jgi:hypothetical protein